MGATPVCQITAAGCARPTFQDCLNYVQDAYRAIYGQDIYLGADSQDGQFMALLANAIHDANGETLAAYNAYSPSTAIGVGLSTVVKINGIRRKSPSYSTCDFLNVGQAGVDITNGIVTDPNGVLWSLPNFRIPYSGQIIVTGTAQTQGAIALSAKAVDTANGKGSISAPQLGWQSVINLTDASVGLPVETDTALRQRQSISTAIPSQTVLQGLTGTVAALTGVTRVKVYENDTNSEDANKLPGHSIALVVLGGDAGQIAQVLAAKKGNVATYGATVQTVTDSAGTPRRITFFRPTPVQIQYALTIKALQGFSANAIPAIQAALSDWTNNLDINEDVLRTRAFVPANLPENPLGSTFEILTLKVGRDGRIPKEQDISIAFNEMPACAPANIGVLIPTGVA